MRISLTVEEVIELKKGNVLNSLLSKIQSEENKEVSPKLLKGMSKAREKRTKDTNKKIEAAINILVMENKKLTTYSVAKKAEVSYNTINKNGEIKKIIAENEKMRVENFWRREFGGEWEKHKNNWEKAGKTHPLLNK